jgi:organic hydroperoxide reductase OsmC/OhrA
MSEHKVTIKWKRELDDFSYAKYDRTHEWIFEGGTVVKASSATKYLGKAEFVNPEEALAAALSSCHMLTFLSIASRRNIIVDSYEDNAVAIMSMNPKGKLAVTKTYLRPKITFSGSNIPDNAQIIEMHHHSHEECFIANSVLTEVIVEPIF